MFFYGLNFYCHLWSIIYPLPETSFFTSRFFESVFGSEQDLHFWCRRDPVEDMEERLFSWALQFLM